MPVSRRIDDYLRRGSWIRKLFEEGETLRRDGSNLPVYDFSIGNPDLEPPPAFRQALRQILDAPAAGIHKYMANTGYLETRAAVAGSLKNDHGVDFVPESILMTVGAAGAINVALKAILDEGEEVIASAPYFVEYEFYAANHGGVLKTVSSTPDFNLNIGAIEAAITDNTRAVIITNPSNPTGIMYPQETLDRLGELLRRRSVGRDRPIFLIDDAPYRKLVFDVPKCTSAFSAYENTLMGTSHSKDLGLPGERIGFLAISPRINDWKKLAAACAFTNRTLGFVNAPALMQRVAAHLQDTTIDLDWYRRKRDRLYNALTGMGYEMPYPAGAFYMFPKAPGGDDLAFVNALKARRVLTVPGRGFGTPGYFRISYCVNDDIIEGALPAFEEVIKELRG